MTTLLSLQYPVLEKELRAIVADAIPLWERLKTENFIFDEMPLKAEIFKNRLQRWRHVVGQGDFDMLNKRLQWADSRIENLRPKLGNIRLADEQPLPDWAEILRDIIVTASRSDSEYKKENALLTENCPEIPFQDILLPAVSVARRQLRGQLGSNRLNMEEPIFSELSAVAYRSLEYGLLEKLAGLYTRTLEFEFSQLRPFGQYVIAALGAREIQSDDSTHYKDFVNKLLQDGLLTFFRKYPVLGRLTAIAVAFWVEFAAEFIQRLNDDKRAIESTFGIRDSVGAEQASVHENSGFDTMHNLDVSNPMNNKLSPHLGKVVDIQPLLSDPHRRGRSVIILHFDSGLKLVYKPKDLGLEVAFSELLGWCNQNSQLLELKAIRLLNCNGYGWAEFIEHRPCVDLAAAERFYERAGMLLCLLYILRATDCHCENLIASGEHLFLIDTETLLHPEPKPMELSLETAKLDTTAIREFIDSVLRTGLLPRWEFNADRTIAYDMSGLGSSNWPEEPRTVARWRNINTDTMHLRYEKVATNIMKNIQRLGEDILSPNEYQKEISIGFERMYRFILSCRDQLLATDGPLSNMRDKQVRFVFRNTRVYVDIQRNALRPECLKNGVDHSIEMEYLCRAFIVTQNKPNAWPICHAELKAMEQLDVPFFSTSTDDKNLTLETGERIGHYFKQTGFQDLLHRLTTLDELDLNRQLAIIQGSFIASTARSSQGEHKKLELRYLKPLEREQLVEEAINIGSDIMARSIPAADGSLNWIGLGYIHEADRYQLQVLNDDLYDGRCGIAVFLAALFKATDDSRFADQAMRALVGLRKRMRIVDPKLRRQAVRLLGVGGAVGLGSMIYGLTKVGEFLGNDSFFNDACDLAQWFDPESIETEQQFDVVSGSAGAILSLLALYRATGEEDVLDKAKAFGNHLVSKAVSYQDAPKAWQANGQRPLTGFSHGAAGISYALLKLYATTKLEPFLEAALDGIEYERSVFSADCSNWPDFLRMEGLNQNNSFRVQWCHGAPGIGLARLGCLFLGTIPDVMGEIEIALQTTLTQDIQVVDHLCCGNLGRVETLLVGAQLCGRADWAEAALQCATVVVNQAKQAGAYGLFPNLPTTVYNPGLFQGVSGIGYQLLRLSQPNLPSVLLWQ